MSTVALRISSGAIQLVGQGIEAIGPTDTKVLWTLVVRRRILCQRLASRADRHETDRCETPVRSLTACCEHQSS
jgi:hypothetical protein